MAPSSGRIGADFTEATKRVIAMRANYRCIVPGCPTPTSGPGASSDEVALTGTACHIYSAAASGPRGRGGFCPEELSSPENGVWACATHGRLIDTNDGAAYPASLLYSWKQLQEAQLKRERDGQTTNAGWLDKFSVQNSFLFECDATLTFGKCTLIQGGAYGKTAVCDWISTVLGEALPERWKITKSPILISLASYVPEPTRLEASFEHGKAGLVINGSKVVEIPRTVSVVYLREDAREVLHRHQGEDDERIAATLGIDRTTLRELAPDIQRNGTPWGRDLAFFDEPEYLRDDDDGQAVYSATETEVVLRRKGVVFRGFSGSENVRVLLEFACALARERVRHKPTILLLDGSGWPFDQQNMDRCGEFLSKEPYQILLTANGGWTPERPDAWREWNRYRVLKGTSSSCIEGISWSEK
jgi:hypothetical protein